MTGLVFKVQHRVYEKCMILTEKDKIMKYKWYFVENKTDYAACLKNITNLLLVSVHKMNFQGCFI